MAARAQWALLAGSIATAAATYVGAAGPPRVHERAPYPFFSVEAPDASELAAHQQLLNRYCITCHNQRTKTAGLALDALSLSNVGADASTWEKVVVKLRAGFMPPVGRPRPDAAAYDAFASWLERELDRAAAANPNPGWNPLFHRLNRAEYQNVVRDLLAVQVDVASLLPPDDASYGFDNMAGVLRMSPTLMERYLSAAQKVGRLAIGTPVLTPDAELYRIPDDLPQEQHLDGLPFGTRGGVRIARAFPVDGEYVIKVRLARDFEDYVPVWPDDQQLEVSVDGRRAQLFTVVGEATHEAEPDEFQPTRAKRDEAQVATAAGQKPVRDRQQIRLEAEQRAQRQQARKRIDADWQVRLPLTAGTHEIVAAFLEKTNALAETVKAPFERPYAGGFNYIETRMQAYLRTVEISGPFKGGAAGNSDSRRRIFVCRPRRPSEEDGCAKAVLSTLARRAYRRPITNADLGVLLNFYKTGRADGTFDDGIELALERLLVSPEFLFRIEQDPAIAAPSRTTAATGAPIARISDVELASRLSFFLWSSIPDDELLNLATKGKLREPAVLEQQVRRMLADRRSSALVSNFAGQWLYLRNLPGVVPTEFVFPDFDESLRQGFRRETELFFEHLVRGDRSVVELLTADYTFVNERLARHYGIPNVSGARFRRVALTGDERRGLLGQGSILTVTSYPQRTSPVLRGKWILENFLGAPPPMRPPNIPDLQPTNAEGKVLSMREQMEQHRANPACAGCHALMDPLGFALENFDAVGKFRTVDSAFEPIDASGVFPDGTKIDGPADLRKALLNHSARFITTVTDKLLTYALGRGVESYDAPAVRAIVRDAEPAGYRFSAVVLGIVQSAPFQMRRPQP
jgi:mono/diheme cytochrome c family protein